MAKRDVSPTKMLRREESVIDAMRQWDIRPDGSFEPRTDEDGNQLTALPAESLVGSWVAPIGDSRGEISGMLVAEPQAGFYLFDVQDWTTGRTLYQRVVTLAFFTMAPDDPIEWRFFETREQMKDAWERAELGAGRATGAESTGP